MSRSREIGESAPSWPDRGGGPYTGAGRLAPGGRQFTAPGFGPRARVVRTEAAAAICSGNVLGIFRRRPRPVTVPRISANPREFLYGRRPAGKGSPWSNAYAWRTPGRLGRHQRVRAAARRHRYDLRGPSRGVRERAVLEPRGRPVRQDSVIDPQVGDVPGTVLAMVTDAHLPHPPPLAGCRGRGLAGPAGMGQQEFFAGYWGTGSGGRPVLLRGQPRPDGAARTGSVELGWRGWRDVSLVWGAAGASESASGCSRRHRSSGPARAAILHPLPTSRSGEPSRPGWSPRTRV
jgi:hypothetical protein